MRAPKARRPPVRYASRAAPGPPENETNTTPIPIRIQGARKPTISMRARMLPVRRTLPLLQLAPHAGQRIPDQAGHVHLRDADALGDFGLREALEEAHVEDGPLTAGQPLNPRRQRDPLLRLLERVV